MVILMVYLVIMMVGAVVTMGLAGWASRGNAIRRNIVGLLLAAAGSYAAGFLLDMLVTTLAGELPPGNVIAPAFSWAVVAGVTTLAAFVSLARPVVLALPFALNAALALLATAARTRNAAVGAVLLVLTVLVLVIARQRATSRATLAGGARNAS
jgi:hypothetical protein